MERMTSQQSKPSAVIDVGTNSVLLVVGRLDGEGQLEFLRQEIRIPRLGQGLQATGLISEGALERGIKSLGELLVIAAEYGLVPADVQVVATAALRLASNGEQVAVRLEQATGCSLQVLPGNEEARLSHRAVAMGNPNAVAVDVGGGSTEVVWNGGDERRSIDLGAMTLSESFDGTSVSLRDSFAAARAWAREQLSDLPSGLAGDHPVALIGGSAVNLACLVKGLEQFDHTQADRVWVTTDQILSLAEDLWLEDLDQRRSRPIESERVSILPAGLLCLGLALESLAAEGGWTRTVGLSHGLLGQLLA